MRVSLISFLFFIVFASTSQTLHLITPFALKDNELGVDAMSNLRSVQLQAKYISKYTGLQLKKYEVEFSKSKVTSFLEKFTCSQNDVVLFYFLGHGFRYKNQMSPFPTLLLTYDLRENEEHIEDFVRRNSISTDEVKRILKSKNPRLLLIFSDACNTEREVFEPIISKGIHLGSISGIPNFVAARHQDLFMNIAGDVTVSSSSPGEVSINISKGSIFTQNLDISLNYSLSTSNPITWENVLDSTKHFTEYTVRTQISNPKKFKQTPYYEINIQKIADPTLMTENQFNSSVFDPDSYEDNIQKGNEFYNKGAFETAMTFYKKASLIGKYDYVSNHNIFLCEVALGKETFTSYNFREACQILTLIEKEKYLETSHFINTQYALGIMYLTGKGCKKNFKKGMKWLGLAAANGNKKAKMILSKFE